MTVATESKGAKGIISFLFLSGEQQQGGYHPPADYGDKQGAEDIGKAQHDAHEGHHFHVPPTYTAAEQEDQGDHHGEVDGAPRWRRFPGPVSHLPGRCPGHGV